MAIGSLIDVTNSTVTQDMTDANTNFTTIVAYFGTTDAAIVAVTAANGSLVSANDTNVGFLNGKLLGGTAITLTENSDGGDETLTIAIKAASTSVSANDTTPGVLNGKIVDQGTFGVTLTENTDGGDETLGLDIDLTLRKAFLL
jgi:hypothetical protein